MNEKVILTKQGYLDLEKKLDELKLVKRPEIVERIKEARAQGDLSENAEYEAARNEQSLIEGQILEIEAKLKNATINDEWMRSVVEYELIPLLKEYWFDEAVKVKDWSRTLREVVK